MRLALVAVGRLKAGPEAELVERYRSRVAQLARPLGFSGPDNADIPEGRERSVGERRAREAAAVASRIAGTVVVAFDERGRTETSARFAERLAAWRDGARPAASFVIGGPDGLDGTIRDRADLVLSFGALTLPHGLVRVLVAEQIYRALTIIAGHPYHREGDGGG